jgi:hypothetical protein
VIPNCDLVFTAGEASSTLIHINVRGWPRDAGISVDVVA